MFGKNDKAFWNAQVLVYLSIGLMAIVSLVAGIWMAVKIHAVYCLIILAGWFGCFILGIFAWFFFSLLTDIKLIRNKLYGESNEHLGIGFVRQKDQKGQNPYEEDD